MSSSRSALKMLTRWGLRLLAALLVLCTLISVVLFYLLGMESGRKFSLEKALGQLPSKFEVDIDGLKTSSLGEWQGESLRIYVNNKELLALESFYFHFDVRALFERHVHLYSFKANRLLLTIPEGEKDKAQTDTNKKPLSFALPENLPEFSIDEVTIAQVSVDFIDQNLQEGESQKRQSRIPDASLHASGYWHHQKPLELEVLVKALNEDPFEVSIHTRLDDATTQAKVQAEIKEAPAGFLGQKLKIPENQALNANINLLHRIEGKQQYIELESLDFPMFNRQFHAQGAVKVESTAQRIEGIQLQLLANDTPLIDLSGNINQSVLDLDVQLHRFPLEILQAWLPQVPSGDISGKVALNGKAAELLVATELNGELRYHNDSLQFDTRLDYQPKVFKIYHLNANALKMQTDVSGDVDFSTNKLNLDFDIKTLPVAKVLAFFPELKIPVDDLKIESMVGRVQGSYKKPEELTGHVNAALSGNYENAPLTLNTKLKKHGAELEVTDLRLNALEGEVHAKGKLNVETETVAMDVQTQAFNIQTLDLLNIELPEDLQAIVNAELKIEGHLREPLFELKADAQGQYQDIPFVIDALAHARETELKVEAFNLQAFGEPVLDMQGEMTKEKIALKLHAGNVPAKLFQAFGWYENIGKISADLQVEAALNEKQLQTLQVNGDLRYAASFNVYDQQGEKKTLPFDWQVKLETRENELVLSSSLDSLETEGGQMRAVFPLSPYISYINASNREIRNFPLKFNIEGESRLRLFSLMVDPDIHRFSGSVHSVLKLDGTLGVPNMSGDLEFIDGAYENTVSGTTLRNVACKINAKGSRLRVYECRASDSYQGEFTLGGELDLANLFASKKEQALNPELVPKQADRIDLELTVNKANLLKHPGVEMLATGNLSISGSSKELLAKGEIDISPLTAFLDETEWGAGIPELDVEEIYEEQTEEAERSTAFPLPKVLLDITIRTRHQAWLRGRGLEAELEGDLKIRGSLDNIRYEGEFKTVRGSMEFFGKKFILETGQVNFVNESVLISLPAVYEKQDIKIRALVEGSGTSISVELSSTPSMPEDEILAYIIFGKTVKKMTAIEAFQVANAVQKLRGSSSSFFDPIATTRELLGADTFYVQSAEDQEGEQGLNVGVGKYINENVYLELEYTPDPTQPWKGRIQIELTPRLSLESTAGGKDGTVGAELKWKKDY